ncbi:hypothetical protein ANO14919_000370 [Xylariales sp. No.14919]|nr:hypothetical protein ANO14919_000370 [Xylariales sp. No.14919]
MATDLCDWGDVENEQTRKGDGRRRWDWRVRDLTDARGTGFFRATENGTLLGARRARRERLIQRRFTPPGIGLEQHEKQAPSSSAAP